MEGRVEQVDEGVQPKEEHLEQLVGTLLVDETGRNGILKTVGNRGRTEGGRITGCIAAGRRRLRGSALLVLVVEDGLPEGIALFFFMDHRLRICRVTLLVLVFLVLDIDASYV